MLPPLCQFVLNVGKLFGCGGDAFVVGCDYGCLEFFPLCLEHGGLERVDYFGCKGRGEEKCQVSDDGWCSNGQYCSCQLIASGSS